LLIESPLGLAEIASRVGYDSEAAFNRAFRRAAGMPPATWRKAKAAAKPAEDEQSGKEDGQSGKTDKRATRDYHHKILTPSAPL
jgi:AraC-like DNA-binding protein